MKSSIQPSNSPDVSLAVVILAAGKGTRMMSDLPKVLHPLNSRPLIHYLLRTTQKLNPAKTVLVVGHQAEQVQQTVGDQVLYAEQVQQKGTGHAVAQAEDTLKEHKGNVLILYGDMPLLTRETLQALVQRQAANDGPLTMLTVVSDNPRGFGRVVRDEAKAVTAIVEEVDCTPEQLMINELNVGVYCVRADWLWTNLANITISAKGEYYLTDLVEIAVKQGHKIEVVTSQDLVETMGINTPEHLAEAERVLIDRE